MNNNGKIYGSSILEHDERLIQNSYENDEYSESDSFDHIKNQYSDSEINRMRGELKNSSTTNKSLDKVSIDAISGIKSSNKFTDNESESMSKIIDSKTNLGKEISSVGIDLIYNLLGTKPTKDELTALSSYFSTLTSADDIYTVDINVLKTILGKRISDKIISIANKNNVSEYEAITKFILEIYKSYISIVQYNDDVNELYDLVMNINKQIDLDNVEDEDTLLNHYKTLAKATEKFKNLDERNKKLKSDYRITDFDILIVDSVKNCLENSLSFKKVYDKVDDLKKKKVLQDLKKDKDVKKSIGNWITDLKNDPDTLYTFPVNDYLTPIKSVDGMIDYIKGFIMLQDNHDAYDKFINIEDSEITDINEYFLSKGYITKHDLDNYEQSAILLLYILSKTFKFKKIKSNDDRRILSYTLDIISKASNIEYASRIMKLINHLSEKFLKINSYNYIETNN